MRIVLIGHTVGIKRCIEKVENSPHQVAAVFTHPRKDHQPDLDIFKQRKDQFGEYAYNVFNVEKDFGIQLHEYQNLADVEEIERIAQYQPDVIITVGCRDILKAHFIEKFTSVINLHPFNLPSFRGAGIDSWMILQGYSGTTQRATCHFINPRIDAGNILATAPYDIPENATPLDIFKIRIDTLGDLMLTALEKLEESADGEIQNDAISVYYPRLNTQRDGKIDFGWSGKEIEIFIRAFSYPYAGAWTQLGERKIHFLHAAFNPQKDVHPFAYGLVFKKNTDQLFIFVKGGILCVTELEENGVSLSPSKIKLGKFLNS